MTTTRSATSHDPANADPANADPGQEGGRAVGVVRRQERGQATAEYALVMLAAAAIAGLLLAWAASTGGIGRLLDSVMDNLIGQTETGE